MQNEKTLLDKTKTFLLQMIPIMLGVYFGIIAGNWNESQKKIALGHQLLEKIEADILSNQAQIQNVIEYHHTLRDTSWKAFRELPKELLNTPMTEIPDTINWFWRGTKTSTLKNAAYQTAIVSGVLADMDLELVSLLSAIDKEQKNYENVGALYVETIINMSTRAPLADYVSFTTFFSGDIVYIEEKLLKMYEEVLVVLKENGITADTTVESLEKG